MKKFILMGTLAMVAWSSVKADEPAATGGGTATGSSMTSTSTVTPIIRKKGVTGPSYRKFEVRAGPRVAMLGGDVRIGQGKFDIWEDLGLDLPNAGVVFDVDWQPYNRFHLMFDLTYDNYDQKGNSQKPIMVTSSLPNIAARTYATGAETKANFHAFQFDGKLGWDAYRDETYRFQAHAGLKGAFTTGKLSMSGTTLGGVPQRDETKLTDGFVVPTFGFDHRVYVVRWVYLGLDSDLSLWDDFFGVNGDLYVGWDITKNWGLRAGYDFTYVDWENPKTDSVAVNPWLHTFYFQAVWGF